MQNLDKLTKQLDALTYNSRSVLNALIRSTVAAGSYNGFTAVKAGHEIVLNRVDIYRLYTFYQDWQNLEMFNSETFESLLASHDSKYLRSTPVVEFDNADGTTTAALVKHSKLLFLTAANVDMVDDNQYWIDLVKDNANPKGIVNACPVPINIRTPIYDENLSTKHFSQFETYLFPSGYHSLQLLGYQGDGVDHSGGGKSWFFDVDGEFIVRADHTILGMHSNDAMAVKSQPYASGLLYSLAYGTESYAYGRNSFAGGNYSFAMRTNGISLGEHNVSASMNAAIVGGMHGTTHGMNAFIGGGNENVVAGENGFAANMHNSAGGARLQFTRDITLAVEGSKVTTECSYILQVGECTYTRTAVNGVPDINGTVASLASNQIIILNTSLSYNKLYRPDFSAGDTICVYGVTTIIDGKETSFDTPRTKPVDDESSATVYKVTNINKVENGNWIVTLDREIVNIDGIIVYGGYVSLKKATYKPYSNMTDTVEVNVGANSATFGYFNIAHGDSQTVVGSCNDPRYDARFIVGVGPNASANNGAKIRDNAMVVSDRYSYMKCVGSYIVMGVSSYDNMDEFSRGQQVLSDEDSLYGIGKITGAYAVITNPANQMYQSIFNVNSDHGELTVNNNGLQINYPTKSGAGTLDGKAITTALGGDRGATVIYAGTDSRTEAPMYSWETSTNADNRGNSVGIFSEDGITAKTPSNIYLSARSQVSGENSYLFADFNRLALFGDTYSALTATCDQRSFNIATDCHCPWTHMRHNRVSHSGFYFNWSNDLDDYGLPSSATNYISCDGYHSFISSYVYSTREAHYLDNWDSSDTTNTRAFDVAGLILPGALNKRYDTSGEKPHITLFTNTIFGDGNNDVDPEAAGLSMVEQLAYVSDLRGVNDKVFAALTPYVPQNVDTSIITLANHMQYPQETYAEGGSWMYNTTPAVNPTQGVYLNSGYSMAFANTENGKPSSSIPLLWCTANTIDEISVMVDDNTVNAFARAYFEESALSASEVKPNIPGNTVRCAYALMHKKVGNEYQSYYVKILDNVNVVYQAGQITVSFNIRLGLSRDYFGNQWSGTEYSNIPYSARAFYQKKSTSASDIASLIYMALTGDTFGGVIASGGSPSDYEKSYDYVNAWMFQIPLSRDFVNNVRPIYNTANECGINLHGQCYWTGDANVWASGYISDYTWTQASSNTEAFNGNFFYAGHGYEMKPQATTTPCLPITLGTCNEYLADNAWIPCVVSGPATWLGR